ncbi:hypothetical protein HZB04_00030 [Candidatus Wolfebacteria bacterium]|nr:hypothetical protein [Candidatus Wolfebacteria bacterium]
MGFTFPFEKWLRKGLPMSQKLTSILRTSEVQKFKSGKIHWSRHWAKEILKKF